MMARQRQPSGLVIDGCAHAGIIARRGRDPGHQGAPLNCLALKPINLCDPAYVNAMFLVKETLRKLRYRKGPDEAIERMTNNLLGYSDEDFERHWGDKWR